jgi:uncharacterized protein YciI
MYYVVEMTVLFTSLDDVQARAQQTLAQHRARSRALHERGDVVMAGAFLQPEPLDGYLRTMTICRTEEAAEAFVAGDPFILTGQVLTHRIRSWANMFAT